MAKHALSSNALLFKYVSHANNNPVNNRPTSDVTRVYRFLFIFHIRPTMLIECGHMIDWTIFDRAFPAIFR